MEGVPQEVCSLCKGGGHGSTNCPELSNPLKDGFYSGGGGGGGHSHEEDEKLLFRSTGVRFTRKIFSIRV